jgi:threonine/homoserine/homoserine lactone efflux protein
LLGWLLALQGAVILVLPGLVQKFQRLSDKFLRIYLRAGGVLLLVLGVLLWRSLRE